MAGTTPNALRAWRCSPRLLAESSPSRPQVLAGLGLRPRPGNPLAQVSSRRFESGESGENNSGHIAAAPNEGILFFDNVFPLRLRWALRAPWRVEANLPELMHRFDSAEVRAADPVGIIKRAVPAGAPLKITEILPRLKEGGAFVKFSHPDGTDGAQIESAVRDHLKRSPIKPWFSPFRRVRSSLVRGQPWLEDLHRLPSSRLRVEFVSPTPGGVATELSQEILYSFFRRYGKMSDIASQPTDSKVLPRHAFVDFGRLRNAVMAKNCLHAYRVTEAEGGGAAGTVLRIGYQRKAKAHWIRDWLVNHPRVVIPAVAALLAAVTVAVFDPIRTFFIKAHVEHSFHLDRIRVYRWFKAQATDIFAFRHREVEDASMRALWEERRDSIEQIRSWLMESAETFIVVQGARGSGKKELVVNEVLKGRGNTLIIDCKPIQEASSDSSTIKAAAAEVGYRPVFSWMNSLSSLIDLAAQGTIGTKAGFSETLDTQLAKILANTAAALKQIALEARGKAEKDAYMSEDEYLEAHPEHRPVVVIDNFLHKSQESSLVYDKIAEWASGLTSTNIAHVIFLTHDVSFAKSLSKALPYRVFRQISLGDCSPEVAKRFVMTHLSADEAKAKGTVDEKDLEELDENIKALGGRLTDLEYLARRIKTGESPSKAVREIIDQSASEIVKMYLLDVDVFRRHWTPEQAWLLVKRLAEDESLRYNEVLLADTFKPDGEAVLQALEQAELITIHSGNGRPYAIRPGKPVYAAAFRLLTQDRVLSSRLDLASVGSLGKLESANIDKYEAELGLLATLPGGGKGADARIRWLMDKLRAAHDKVEAYEREGAALKGILQREY
ncbi:MAG: mitochondrial escape protein 2 [Thelocarpon impressellum]|nr:MAG: mitochondrial escape protein 2 [Thelocarpon impressellum]